MKHLAKYEYDDDGNLKLKPERKPEAEDQQNR